MPRGTIPVTTVTRSGVAPPTQTDADATNKHEMTNNGRTIIEIVSSDAGPQTVEFEIPSGAVDGQAVTPKSVAVPAGATRITGPFPAGIYNQTGGKLYVDPSVSTSLKFRAYSLT